MIEKLRNKLKLAANFPSPPAVAQQIIELAADPEIDVVKVAKAMSKDPALTAKILRTANSPLYSKQRKSENLRQALVVLGLNAATTLALSFSLVGTYKAARASRIDLTRYWRRTILSASAARAFAELKHIDALEDIFLAALLQDIAMLAIDRVEAEFYEGLPPHATHAQHIAHEMSRIGADHASLSGWLLGYWKLPEALCKSVELSHTPESADSDSRIGLSARCLALGSECAEMLLGERTSETLGQLAAHAEVWLGITSDMLGEAMQSIVAKVPEIERLFDAALLNSEACAAILEQAQELLLMRNLQTIQQVGALEDKHRRDALTRVFNRGYLDEVLDSEFRSALAGGWPLSIVFADLDQFKQVNDTYGHQAGDTVLIATAKILLEVVRESDCVARFGGEEFVIVLPGLGSDGARHVADRLLARLRTACHSVNGGTVIATASLGLATHHAGAPFDSAAKLLEAADRAVYMAKRQGRNQLVTYDAKALAGGFGAPESARHESTDRRESSVRVARLAFK